MSSKASLEKLKQDGKYLIGLEVTEPALQLLLDENVDPQHSGEKRTDTSAIDSVFKSYASIIAKAGEQPSKYVAEHDKAIEQIIQSCADKTTTIELHEKGFTVVESPYRKAFDMGYTQSPLVVACNKKFDPRETGTTQVKVTIGQHPSAQLIDFNKLIKDLNAVEPSYVEKENQWGGSSTIIGSPVNTSTLLDLEKITDIVGDLMPTASDF